MLLNELLSKKRVVLIVILCLFVSILFSQIRDWEQLFQAIDRPVVDMKDSSIGLLFALPGNGGGLAYFTEQDSLNIYSIATNLGAVSIVPDDVNNRIFCAFGCGSYSDGLYEFDVTTQEFELIDWYFYPHFVKKLSSGFYYGYGYNMDGGLLHSANGEEWTEIDFFNNKDVTDIEENGDGKLFISAGNEIYLENEGSYTFLTTPSSSTPTSILPFCKSLKINIELLYILRLRFGRTPVFNKFSSTHASAAAPRAPPITYFPLNALAIFRCESFLTATATPVSP